MSDTFKRVRDIVAEYLGPEEVEGLSMDTTFADLDFDWMDIIDVVWDVEERFAVSVPGDIPEGDIKTIGDIVRAVDKATREAETP